MVVSVLQKYVIRNAHLDIISYLSCFLSIGKPSILMQANLGYGLDQTWSAYKYGFSDSNGGYWIGFENVYRMTNNGKTWKLCIDGNSELGIPMSSPYNQYVQDGEDAGYTYLVSGPTGCYDLFGTTSRKHKFSTKDVNNQPCCCAAQAASCKGGWWYSCEPSLTSLTTVLNGAGKSGFYWRTPYGTHTQLKYTYIRAKQA